VEEDEVIPDPISEDAIELYPTLESMKCDTPEMPRRSIIDRVMSVKLPGRDWFSGPYERAEEESEEETEDGEGKAAANKTEEEM